MYPDAPTNKFLADLARAIFRHKKKGFIVFCAVVGLAVAAVILLPRTYSSEAKLFVRLGRESIALDPTATTGQTMALVDSREMEINSVLEVLRSRGLAEKVVARIGIDKILDRTPAPEGEGIALAEIQTASFLPSLGFLRGLDPIDDKERAITTIESSLKISSPKRTTVIDLGSTASSPDLAQEMLVALLEAYRFEHSELNRTEGSLAFFEEQTELLRQQVTAAHEELRNIKDEGELVSVDGQRAMLQQHMTVLEAESLAARSSLVAADAKIKAMEASLARYPERMKTLVLEGVAHEGTDGMRKAFYDLELRQAELQAKLTADNPLLKEINRQVAEARAIMDAQNEDRTHVTWDVNPVHRQFMTDLALEEIGAAGSRARLISLGEQRSETLARLKALNDHEVKIVSAVRKTEQLESAYRSYLEKREQARIDAALIHDRISNVNVAQAPVRVAKPISPKKPLVMLAGLVFAAGASLCVMLGAEFLDRRLQTAKDVERLFEAPVLTAIPRLSRHRVMLN